MIFQQKSVVLWNTMECSGYYRLGITCDAGYSAARPGQFVMVRFPGQLSPLLRRPFSIHRLVRTDGRTEGIELLYKVVGRGTEMLSLCRKGDGLDLLGPLGNGFTIPDHPGRIFIVAGGIGVAPMFFLTSVLREQGLDPARAVVFIGGRSKDDLLCMNDFFSVGMQTVHITTDDGSAGEKDRVTGPLERAIREARPDMIYACGPTPMLKATARLAEDYGVPCEISIETLMACGMGACLGCAVRPKKQTGKYLHACLDGPVFDARTLQL
ncbi:dihydroorotate dehydrogenase electron transfer s ubunit [Desulfonema ishimotonii]|uniref:Dihydroorotate dehydrogenase B (NAD(+)), electron transfer subunit n=1 Tax=Desulfonema ishimotonii TaxID=45657 RepID=A0A401G4I9_9BACT|nr:dihydroorotate dehydrogenase electron transfer subunit [Desulfonema ishimotonii]GBC64152.1 dihydroorotate dehydrogenase electron transfer s ubunit [Desulfonema ishimotonii]